MDMNTVSGAFAYEKSTTTKLEESLTVTDKSVSYAKSVENTTEEAAAVVYQKSSKDAVKSAKADLDIVNRMKADLQKRKDQLRSLVEQMLNKQGKAFTDATDMWEMLRTGKLEVDPATAQQAQADIAEDGYWGVEQTSNRLVEFAKGLAGNDAAYADELLAAMKKGFEQATGEWGFNWQCDIPAGRKCPGFGGIGSATCTNSGRIFRQSNGKLRIFCPTPDL